jgi:hypothetical protein
MREMSTDGSGSGTALTCGWAKEIGVEEQGDRADGRAARRQLAGRGAAQRHRNPSARPFLFLSVMVRGRMFGFRLLCCGKTIQRNGTTYPVAVGNFRQIREATAMEAGLRMLRLAARFERT